MKSERGKSDSGNPNRRVLVVDDDPDILLLLQEILRQEAYVVEVATSGQGALELARAKDYDLILLDRRLPDMDARDIVDEINNLPQPPTIIMMSAYTALLHSTIEALRREVYDYLAKPFDLEKLKLAVQRGLERKELLDVVVENANLYRAEQKKVSQYSTLANMSAALIAEIELPGRLKVILQSSVAAVKAADAGIIFLYDEYNDDLVAGYSLGLVETAVGKVALKPNEGFVGQVFQTEQPLMLSNIDGIAACAENINRPNLLQLRRAWGNILFPKGILCVPLILRDKKIGVITLFNLQKEDSFTDDDCSLIQSAANVGAQAIAVAQLMEALKSHEENLKQLSLKVISAQEEERKRVARELHDEMTQALIALKLHAETVKKDIPPKLVAQRKGLEEIDAIINRALEDVHRLITDLRPVLLDDLGLIPALKWHIRNYSKRYPIEVTLKTALKERLPAGIEVTLYRIIQEALSNVAKHAQAENVDVALEKIGSQVKTTIVDDGVGFEAQELYKGSTRKGFGLLGICERASLMGGTCEIKSARGRGTILEITLPISTEEQMYQGAKA